MDVMVQDFGKDSLSENESQDDEHTEYSGFILAKESDSEDVTSSTVKDGRKSDAKKAVPTTNQVPGASGDSVSSSESSKSEKVDNDALEKLHRPLRKGDRIKYVGPSMRSFAGEHIKEIPTGQRGEVYKVEADCVAVILDKKEKDTIGEKDPTSGVLWLKVSDVKHDLDAQAEDCYIAMEALCEVLQSNKPLIVYFVDSSLWLSRAAPKTKRQEFVSRVHQMFDLVSGPVVLICGQNKVLTIYWEREKFIQSLSKFGRQDELPLGLRRLTEGVTATKRSRDIFKLFANVMCIHPPEDEDLLKMFKEQLVEDRRILISRSNLIELHRVLEEHNLSCSEFFQVDTDGVLLTKRNAEQVVGLAKNNYLSSCLLPSIEDKRLMLPRSSLEAAISRFKPQEKKPKTEKPTFEDLADNEWEEEIVPAVVPHGEIGVQFDDVGALEDVKKAFDELILLPMRRPELFAHGNLLRPCKGILLFGPPGTGKTLIAKALANEAGANFITVTSATLTSKWYGDEEKYAKALFTFASKLAKLAPVIIFIDEIDSMLGSRGGYEHEAARKLKTEFMTAWDGLRTQENERVLVLGATNRPFDIDDAVLRRMPRRILVDLPDAENRLKILKIQLAQENLETGFSLEELAKATEGYSGSDLKNLCIAAAFRPVEELLEEEKVCKETASTTLRRLRLDDFIQSKSKVRASVSRDSISIIQLREWDEMYGEGGSRKKTKVEDLAKGPYEKAFISTVVPPGEIGVQFDDVGALEDVKTALDELIILPMRRPELFAHGNLLRPCKGMLLFGPPGTGKTLIAKALATESGAYFITVTNATLTSKWYGEEQKYTKALFTFASKIAKLGPVIIFIDEIDAMLQARGKGFEQDMTRKMRNEFMTAWDGLRTQENERVLILGATNRPFDIDDAVIRRMPRRILVDLPDASNRMKILKIQLAQENLETGFSIEELARATEGYSGSDLKNLCMAAAYRPVRELLEEEKVCKETASTTLRQLRLDDFIQSKSKVGASVSRDSTSIIELREWNKKYGESGSRTESPPIGF